jgi:hypothetical protein
LGIGNSLSKPMQNITLQSNNNNTGTDYTNALGSESKSGVSIGKKNFRSFFSVCLLLMLNIPLHRLTFCFAP